MPDIPSDEELLKLHRATAPSDSDLKALGGKTMVGFKSSDVKIGDTGADKSPQMSAGPSPLVEGALDVAQGGAFMAGEAGGALGGAALGEMAAGPAGAVRGAQAGRALGGGATATLTDIARAYMNHKLYGHDIDLGWKAIFEDFIVNSGVSGLGSAAGKAAEGGIPAEAKAVQQATDHAMAAKQQFQDRVTSAGQLATEGLQKKQESQLGEVAPQAAREAIERSTGRSATAAAASKVAPIEETGLPSVEEIRRQGGPRMAYMGVHERMGDELGKPYQEFDKNYGSAQIVDKSPLLNVANKWEDVYAGRRMLSPDEQAELGNATSREMPSAAMKLVSRVREMMPASYLDTAEANVKGPLPQTTKDALERLPELDQPMTFNQVLGLKRDAQALMVGAKDGETRKIAWDVVDAATQTLSHIDPSKVPPQAMQMLRDADTNWRAYKEMFPRTDIAKMAKANDPIIAGEHLFNNWKLANTVFSKANPEEQQAMRDSFGDWAQYHLQDILPSGSNRQSMKLQAQNMAGVLQKMFPDSPLAKPDNILVAGATIKNLADSPLQMQAFQRSMQQAQADAVKEAAPKVRELAMSAAKDLGGPAGERLERELESAKTPEEAAMKGFQFFTKMTPQQFVQSIGKDQGFATSAAEQYIPGHKGFGFWMKRMASDPGVWPWIAGMGMAQTAMSGRPSWYLDMAAIGAPMMLRREVANVWAKGLADSGVAQEFLQGTRAARLGVMSPLARLTLKGTFDEVGNRLAHQATDFGKLDKGPKEEEEAAPDEAP